MSEARPEKHDGRRHDSQDGVVLPNLSRLEVCLSHAGIQQKGRRGVEEREKCQV